MASLSRRGESEESSLHWLAFFIDGLQDEVNNMEKWKDVVGYEGMYQVSNFGNIKSLNRISLNNRSLKGRLLSQRTDKDGYKIVTLFKNGVRVDMKVHRCVASAFISNPCNYPEVNHKDESKANNNVSNLEWCTSKYNANYGTRSKKISAANKGCPRPYMKGANNYFYGKHYCGELSPSSKVVLKCDTGGNVLDRYTCTREAAEAVGCSQSAISMGCLGKRKTVKGYTWKYA